MSSAILDNINSEYERKVTLWSLAFIDVKLDFEIDLLKSRSTRMYRITLLQI